MENYALTMVAPSCTPQQETRAPTDSTNAPTRSVGLSAGSGAPLLDIEYRNVPRVQETPPWRRKQFTTRRSILDLLRYWQWNGYQCLWVTLTSAPDQTEERLRKDFQVLRKRISREFDCGLFHYVCVDTLEGHGVLHMIWAFKDPNSNKRASFYIPFEWLQENWKQIHGAFHVNVKRIGTRDKDALRLSRYIVAQYCGDQCGLVRLSQSRMPLPFAKMRQTLLQELRRMPEKYFLANAWGSMSAEEFKRQFNGWFWGTFRAAWDELITKCYCTAFGVQFVWIDSRLERV